jgi:hypothetical protein
MNTLTRTLAGVALAAGLTLTVATPLDATTQRPVSEGAKAAIRRAGLPMPGSETTMTANTVPISTFPKNPTPINNTWKDLCGPRGAINCRLEIRQPSRSLVVVRKVSGKVSRLGIETYVYDSQFMADYDYYNGDVPNGMQFEARAAFDQKICFVYVHWRDGVGAYRDALYVRGGKIV